MKINGETIERLADLEHKRWAGWMKYLFTKGWKHPDGSFTIDAGSVAHWEREIKTAYADLSEAAKDSDRKEVRKTILYLSGKH